MARKVADCRELPGESWCSLTITGEENEVVRVATMHAVDAHGHSDGPELRERIRSMLADGGQGVGAPTHPDAVTPRDDPLLNRVVFGNPPLGDMLLELE